MCKKEEVILKTIKEQKGEKPLRELLYLVNSKLTPGLRMTTHTFGTKLKNMKREGMINMEKKIENNITFYLF
jgi:hypothetical protein